MKRKTVMVIDDDKVFLEELEEMLKLAGYELAAVTDASRAVDAAKEIRPAVVLLDLKMPRKSGFEVAHELKGVSELSDVPIIAMTGFFKDDYRPLLNMCGIKRCLKKPLQPLDVIAEIEWVLSGVEENI